MNFPDASHQVVYLDDSGNPEPVPVDLNNQGSSMWTWILIIIAIVVIIVGVVLIIWWATSGGSDDNNTDTGTLAIVGSEFVTNSSTTITSTWTRVGDVGDVVTMFVNPSGQEMKFDKNGSALGSYFTSGPIVSPGTTATVVNLKSNVTYDAILIVTNPKVSGFNGSHHASGIVPSSPIVPGTKFTISSSAQGGQISYTPSSSTVVPTPPPLVSYKLNTSNPNNSLFYRDPNGYICATSQSELLTTTSECADTSFVLYSQELLGSTGNTNLAMIRKSDLSDITTAQWKYNTGNEWCINSDSSTQRCMLYDPSFVALIPANGSTTTLDTIQPIDTDQPIFITSGTGSRWKNQPF